MIIDKKQLRDDIEKRKELPDFGISPDKNIQRLRIITETRKSFTPEVVEALLDELDELNELEEKYVIRGFEDDYHEKYGTVITDSGTIKLKISDLRGLAYLAACQLRKDSLFGRDDLIGATLIIKNGYPTGLMLNGVIWRAR